MTQAPKRPRVLIADDHPGVRMAMIRLLLSRCDVVGSVGEGCALIREQKRLLPDVVVVDILLPGLNGIETSRSIKAVAPRTRVVITSRADDADLRDEARAAGASRFISKMRLASDLLPAVLDSLEDTTTTTASSEARHPPPPVVTSIASRSRR